MILQIILGVFLFGNCCNSDLEILKAISKSEKHFYSNKILPKSTGKKVDKKSYLSIVKRKTSVRETVLSKIRIEVKNFQLASFDTFYLAEGADGAYSYGYIWSDSLLVSYRYNPLGGSVTIEILDRSSYFNSHEGAFLSHLDNWSDDLKQKPIWSNPSLMGGLCYFVSRVNIIDLKCVVETIGLYEFRLYPRWCELVARTSSEKAFKIHEIV